MNSVGTPGKSLTGDHFSTGGHRTLLSHTELISTDTLQLCDLAADFAARPKAYRGILEDRRVGLLFSAPSTRTRAAFWRAATDLGADVISFGPEDLQLTTGESWEDTGRVLSEYLDAVVIRNNGPLEEMRDLAQSLPATINALSKEEHPTQALADYCAMHEHFGDVAGIRLAYCGEGNNTAAALALVMARIPDTRCDLYCPPGFGLNPELATIISDFAERSGAVVREFEEIPDSPDTVDVVYATRWQSMGVPHTSEDWRAKFEPFRVSGDVFERFAEPGRTVFMHDLPAVRGEEVSAEILDGGHSIVGRQAHHKQSAAGAALVWCLGRAENALASPL